jgi:hypothetical protein
LGDTHKETVSVDVGLATVLDHIEESGGVEDDAVKGGTLVDFVRCVCHNLFNLIN